MLSHLNIQSLVEEASVTTAALYFKPFFFALSLFFFDVVTPNLLMP